MAYLFLDRDLYGVFGYVIKIKFKKLTGIINRRFIAY